MKQLTTGDRAVDFTGLTIGGESFDLSQYKGELILLSFFRNGACAMCNLRIHEMIGQFDQLRTAKIRVVAVFESSPEDMKPYVGQQAPPFTLLADAAGKIYDLYHVESSPEKVQAVIKNETARERIRQAEAAGFNLIQQANSNFFRMPADFLIDENFTIVKAHYSNEIIDHLPLEDVFSFAKDHTMI